MRRETVSVIIPVYNVRNYLDRCMESVVGQTYTALEIILIDDGSTDGSSVLCDEWKDKDKRISVIHQKNAGLGPARNVGIRVASGEYIAFIDSDDWWELDAIEKLYTSAVCNNADIVYMNFYFSYTALDGTIKDDIWIRRYLFDGVEVPKENSEIIFDTDARMWSKLFRKKLFSDNDICMPAHPFEDFPVMPLLALYANKVCQVHEPLYHYYFKRSGNLIGSVKSYEYIATGVKELYNSFAARGFLEDYKGELEEYIYQMCVFAVNDLPLRVLNEAEYNDFLERFKDVVSELIPGRESQMTSKICLWGSYSSRLICYNLLFSQKQIIEHYMFSSISGLYGTVPQMVRNEEAEENPFRMDMINKEIGRDFYKRRPVSADYFFMDFLEEMNPIIEIENGYLTYSEALKEQMIVEGNILDWKSDTDKRWNLWEKECNRICDYLMTWKDTTKIVLLKLFLANSFGTDTNNKQYFPDKESIESANNILEQMYDYFIHRMGEKMVTVVSTDEYDNYTYKYTKYGCLPCYYNGKFHTNVARKINHLLLNGQS